MANAAESANGTDPALSAVTAVQAAARQLNLPLTEALVVEQTLGGPSQAVILSDGGISQNAIPANLVYEAIADGAVRLAWNVEIYELSSLHWWTMRIDAISGELLSQTDYVNRDNWGERSEDDPPALNPDDYRVFALPLESPYDGPRTLEADPAGTASPFGWHDTNGVAGAEFTITQGNNVHADTDLDANNTPDGNSPDGGAGLVFDFPFDPADQPADYI
ncbi:MAG: metalloprotease, partial [Anaerolineae bacterium]|nr:metalloprotease [Anaerolineae bacterium]